MKHYRKETPKTISQLRIEETNLRKRLTNLLNSVRKTRFSSTIGLIKDTQTCQEIREKLQEISYEIQLIEARQDKLHPKIKMVPTIRTPPLSNSGDKNTETRKSTDSINTEPHETENTGESPKSPPLSKSLEDIAQQFQQNEELKENDDNVIKTPNQEQIVHLNEMLQMKKQYEEILRDQKSFFEDRLRNMENKLKSHTEKILKTPNQFDTKYAFPKTKISDPAPKAQNTKLPKSNVPNTNVPIQANINASNKPNNAFNNQTMQDMLKIIQNMQQPQEQNLPNATIGDEDNSQYEVQTVRKSYIRRLGAIPIFDGESYKSLCNFLDIAEALNDSWINDEEKTEFIDTLSLQIRGEARKVVGNLYESNFDAMKNSLMTHFSYLANKDIITSQLENLHQENKESITEYANRARNILREKCATYKHLTEEQKRDYNRTARRAFAKGIKDQKIQDKVVTRGASSLEDAIAYAIELENDLVNTIPRSEFFCTFCKVAGHRERECKRKESNGVNQLVNIFKAAALGNAANFSLSRNRIPIRPINRNWGYRPNMNNWNNRNRNILRSRYNNNNNNNNSNGNTGWQNRGSYNGNNYSRNQNTSWDNQNQNQNPNRNNSRARESRSQNTITVNNTSVDPQPNNGQPQLRVARFNSEN